MEPPRAECLAMPLTRAQERLRRIARRRIADGTLPAVQTSECWGGAGSRRSCALCGDSIPPEENEFEVEVEVDGARLSYCFHLFCHTAWQLECARATVLHSQLRPPAGSLSQ